MEAGIRANKKDRV